jgi:hypothetical protein
VCFPGTGGGRGCSNVVSRGAVGLGGRGGGIEGVPDCLYIRSFGGRAGAPYESREAVCDRLSSVDL